MVEEFDFMYDPYFRQHGKHDRRTVKIMDPFVALSSAGLEVLDI
jgi:hypothetical protein